MSFSAQRLFHRTVCLGPCNPLVICYISAHINLHLLLLSENESTQSFALLLHSSMFLAQPSSVISCVTSISPPVAPRVCPKLPLSSSVLLDHLWQSVADILLQVQDQIRIWKSLQ